MDDGDTLESLRAALRAAEARAEVAEERAAALEELIALVPGIVLEYTIAPGEQTFRPQGIGGAGVVSVLGYDGEDALRDVQFFPSIIHPDDRARADAEAIRFLQDGHSHLSPHRMIRKDGSIVWVDTHFTFVPPAEGRPGKLRSVVFDITRRMEAEQHANEALANERALRKRLDGFIANVPGVVWETYFENDYDKQRVDYVSEGVEALLGYSVEEWKQPNFWLSVAHPDDRAQAQEDSKNVLEQGRGSISHRWLTKDGREIWVTSQMTVIRDDAGAALGLRGVTMDITDMKRAEVEWAQTRLNEEVLRAREESLLALSTPLVPIDDDILAMPLVGELDERRADRVLETLLDGVTRAGARAVILDVTGVPRVDQETADLLLRAAKAVKLLGAEIVLTGIGPEVARTLVELGAELGSIVTRGTLRAGIAHVMQARKGMLRKTISRPR